MNICSRSSPRPKLFGVLILWGALAMAGVAFAQPNVGQLGGKAAAPAGGAMQEGIGQVVSQLAKSGLHGKDLAAYIHNVEGKGKAVGFSRVGSGGGIQPGQIAPTLDGGKKGLIPGSIFKGKGGKGKS